MAGSIGSELLPLNEALNRAPLVVITASFEISCLERRNSRNSWLLNALDFGVSFLLAIVLPLMIAVDR